MNTYSQNREDIAIAKYFDGYKGTLLDIGANDGKTLSNSLALIESGWKAVLVEPSPKAYEKLIQLHHAKPGIYAVNCAIGIANGTSMMKESGSIFKGVDTSLVSTLSEPDYEKWKGATTWTEVPVEVETWDTFRKGLSPVVLSFDFISIDAEGLDVAILQQMDLRALGCKCLIVEHNSDKATELSIRSHAEYYGLKNVLLRNAENICLTV